MSIARSKMAETSLYGTDFWNDSCDLEELTQAVAAGAVGATSNPVIVATVVEKDSARWTPVIDRLVRDYPGATEDEISWKLIAEVGRAAADILLPSFDRSDGLNGRLSLQVNPKNWTSARRMVEDGLQLADIAPNITIKIPAVSAGLEAMEELTAQGISVNATVSFTLAQLVQSAEAIERGLSRRVSTSPIAPCVTLLVGRIDDLLQAEAASQLIADPGIHAWGGVAVFKKAYHIFRERGYRARLLAASYRSHLQWSQFVGGNVILTIPFKFWQRFNSSNIQVKARMDQPVDDEILDQLQAFPSFRVLSEESAQQVAEFHRLPSASFTIDQFLSGLDKLHGLVRRRILETYSGE